VRFDDEETLNERYAALLAPISRENAVGVDVRTTAVFDWSGLRLARKGEGSGHISIAGEPIEGPDWEKVSKLASLALQRYTKDLQIGMWLTQALTLTAGFEGLHDGLFVVRELIRRYWNKGLYPRLEDDADSREYESTTQELLLRWFDEELAAWIRMIPLTPEINGARYSLGDYTSVTLKLKGMELRNDYWSDRAAEHGFLFELQRAMREAGESYFDELNYSIRRVREEIVRLVTSLSSVGVDESLRRTVETLDLCASTLAEWGHAGQSARPRPSVAEREPSQPEPVPDPWERGLAWIRLQRFEMAADLVESVLTAAQSERDRFLRKAELAKALFDVKRYDLAMNVLHPLSEQIERFHLEEWEAPSVVGGVWQVLYDCYRCSGEYTDKARELELRISRMTPWISLRGLLNYR
jgi:type VI secretion system ImpA family protein